MKKKVVVSDKSMKSDHRHIWLETTVADSTVRTFVCHLCDEKRQELFTDGEEDEEIRPIPFE